MAQCKGKRGEHWKHVISSKINDMYMVPQPYRPPDGLKFCIGKIRHREYAGIYGGSHRLMVVSFWHNARENAESCGTIHLEINFSSKVYCNGRFYVM